MIERIHAGELSLNARGTICPQEGYFRDRREKPLDSRACSKVGAMADNEGKERG